jgi:hypothetical protein
MIKQIETALADFKFPEQLVVLVTGGRKFGKPPTHQEYTTDEAFRKLVDQRATEARFVGLCLFDIAQLHGGRTSWMLETTVLYDDLTIVQGGANGADKAAEQWGVRHAGGVRTYPADWDKHGKSAGSIRNQLMLFDTQPHIVLAFPGGAGTADMVRKAERAGVLTIKLVYPLRE